MPIDAIDRKKLAIALYFAFVLAAIVLALLRGFGVMAWPWGVALAPFTLLGVVAIALSVATLKQLGHFPFGPGSGGDVGETPAPDHLETPIGAKEAGEQILERHPELLAAVCLGIKFKRFVPRVLGRPVEDEWGVYEAALAAGPSGLQELRMIANMHTTRMAQKGKKGNRLPSDSMVLKKAAEAFKRCARKVEGGRHPVGCTFEHVTAMFGAGVPSRDNLLRTVAPRVRTLLEREYPQLSTATLTDGTAVKFDEWRKQAAGDRRELAKVRKDHEREVMRVKDLEHEIEDLRAQCVALRDGMATVRAEAHETAREKQEQVVRELHDTLAKHQAEEVRHLYRFEAETDRLRKTIGTLTEERDELERALFAGGDAEDEDAADGLDAASAEALNGLRVLLVGGHEGQIPPIRESLEGHGAQLVHADGPGAENQVGGSHAVVLWIRFIAHPTAWAVKRECRAREVPCFYWARTSPPSLAGLVGRGVGGGETARSE